MKKILPLMTAGFLVLAASATMAANKTDMNSNWVCKTNASTATTDADKAADDKMANHAASAANSFASAAQNCRDCTTITCEVND